jgi:hypothetical protein
VTRKTAATSTYATANARQVRSCGSRARRHHPSAQTGTSNGLTSTSWKGRSRYHGSLLPELPLAIAADSAS